MDRFHPARVGGGDYLPYGEQRVLRGLEMTLEIESFQFGVGLPREATPVERPGSNLRPGRCVAEFDEDLDEFEEFDDNDFDDDFDDDFEEEFDDDFDDDFDEEDDEDDDDLEEDEDDTAE